MLLICVLIPLCMCSHTTCPHTRNTIYHYYICVLILLHVPKYYYICVLQVDVAVVQRTMGDHLLHALHCLLNFLVSVSIMFTISWKITLVVLSLSPVCLLVIRIQVLRRWCLKRALIEP